MVVFFKETNTIAIVQMRDIFAQLHAGITAIWLPRLEGDSLRVNALQLNLMLDPAVVQISYVCKVAKCRALLLSGRLPVPFLQSGIAFQTSPGGLVIENRDVRIREAHG
jgi:hypothetical protein